MPFFLKLVHFVVFWILLETVSCTLYVALPFVAQFPPLAIRGKAYRFAFAPSTFFSDQDLNYKLEVANSVPWLEFRPTDLTLQGLVPRNAILGTLNLTIVAYNKDVKVQEILQIMITDERPLKLRQPVSEILSKVGDSPSDGWGGILLVPQQPFELVFPDSLFVRERGGQPVITYHATLVDNTPLPAWMSLVNNKVPTFSGIAPEILSTLPLHLSFSVRLIASTQSGYETASLVFRVAIGDQPFYFGRSYGELYANAGIDINYQLPNLHLGNHMLGYNDGRIKSLSLDSNYNGKIWLDTKTGVIKGSFAESDQNDIKMIKVIANSIYGDLSLFTLQLGIQQSAEVSQDDDLFKTEKLQDLFVRPGESFRHELGSSINNSKNIKIQATFIPADANSWVTFDESKITLVGTTPISILYQSVEVNVTITSLDSQEVIWKTLTININTQNDTNENNDNTGKGIDTKEESKLSASTLILIVVFSFLVLVLLIIILLYLCIRGCGRSQQNNPWIATARSLSSPSKTSQNTQIIWDGPFIDDTSGDYSQITGISRYSNSPNTSGEDLSASYLQSSNPSVGAPSRQSQSSYRTARTIKSGPLIRIPNFSIPSVLPHSTHTSPLGDVTIERGKEALQTSWLLNPLSPLSCDTPSLRSPRTPVQDESNDILGSPIKFTSKYRSGAKDDSDIPRTAPSDSCDSDIIDLFPTIRVINKSHLEHSNRSSVISDQHFSSPNWRGYNLPETSLSENILQTFGHQRMQLLGHLAGKLSESSINSMTTSARPDSLGNSRAAAASFASSSSQGLQSIGRIRHRRSQSAEIFNRSSFSSQGRPLSATGQYSSASTSSISENDEGQIIFNSLGQQIWQKKSRRKTKILSLLRDEQGNPIPFYDPHEITVVTSSVDNKQSSGDFIIREVDELNQLQTRP